MKKTTKHYIIKTIYLTIFFLFMFLTVFNTNIVIAEKNLLIADTEKAETKKDTTFHGIGPGEAPSEVEEVSGTVDKVLKVVQFVGMVASVVMIIILGMRYFLASHKPEGKAQADQQLFSILLGTILVLSATVIVTFIGNFSQDNINV